MRRQRGHWGRGQWGRGQWGRAAAGTALALLGVVLLVLHGTHAAGAPAPTSVAVAEDSGKSNQPSNTELTRTQAQALVQKRYGARVVRVSTADEDGRHIYVFRLLSTGGKVWTVRIDAQSGVELP